MTSEAMVSWQYSLQTYNGGQFAETGTTQCIGCKKIHVAKTISTNQESTTKDVDMSEPSHIEMHVILLS